jgi:hypothetical protein
MTLTDIESALHNTPFVPFDLAMENGRVLHVPHPDFLLLDAGKQTAVIADDEHFRVLDLQRVLSITFRTRKRTR